MDRVKAFFSRWMMPLHKAAMFSVIGVTFIALFIVVAIRGQGEDEAGAAVALEAAPTGVLTEAQMDDALAQAGWPQSLWPDAKFVAECESGWDTNAYNGTHVGLMQLDPNLHTWRSPTLELWSAYGNLTAALSLYNEVGWSAWDCAAG